MLLCWQFAKWNAYFRIDGAIWCVWNANWWYSMCEKLVFQIQKVLDMSKKWGYSKMAWNLFRCRYWFFDHSPHTTSAFCFTCFIFSGAELYFVKINSTCRVLLWNLGLILKLDASWKVTLTEPMWQVNELGTTCYRAYSTGLFVYIDTTQRTLVTSKSIEDLCKHTVNNSVWN